MNGNLRFIINNCDFINRKGKEKKFFDNFFQTLQYHIIYAYFM